jgi:hypothetical protein
VSVRARAIALVLLLAACGGEANGPPEIVPEPEWQWESPLDRRTLRGMALAGNGDLFVLSSADGITGIRRRPAATQTWNGILDIPAPFDSHLAVDAGGNAVIAWAGSQGGAEGMRFTGGEAWVPSWSVQQQLTPASGEPVAILDVAIAGGFLAVLESGVPQPPDFTQRAAVTLMDPDGRWLGTHDIPVDDAQRVQMAMVHLGSQVRLVVAWDDVASVHADVLTHSVAGGQSQWLGAVRLDDGGGRMARLDDLQMSPLGIAIVALRTFDDVSTLSVARFRSGRWETPVVLGTGGADEAARVAIDPGGAALAAWPHDCLSACKLDVWRSTDVSWSAPVDLLAGVASPQVLRTAVATSGLQAMVMWYHQRDGRLVLSSRWFDGDAWTTPTDVITGLSGILVEQHVLAIDGPRGALALDETLPTSESRLAIATY